MWPLTFRDLLSCLWFALTCPVEKTPRELRKCVCCGGKGVI